MDNMTNQTQSNQQPQQSFSTTLLLKHGRSNTSPIRTMTNGSIMNHSMNMNRLYNSLPGHTTTNVSNGEVNGNNMTSPPNGAPPFEVDTWTESWQTFDIFCSVYQLIRY